MPGRPHDSRCQRLSLFLLEALRGRMKLHDCRPAACRMRDAVPT